MEHIPITESDVDKVYRIARELGGSVEEAAVTCDAFHLAFSDEGLRRAIFGIIDQLDDEAYNKGEPMGLIIRYTVELGMDGIRVGRYADEIPAGQVVTLTPTNRAMILLKIKDNFPTQEFLGPIIMNRPELPSAFRHHPHFRDGVVRSDSDNNELPSLDRRSTGQSSWPERGCPVGRGSLTASEITEREITERELPTELPSHWPVIPICLGPIRLTFNERFPCVSAARSSSQPALPAFQSKALDPHHHLPPWAALLPAVQSSGLSPPFHAENLGHSDRKMFLRPLA